MKLAVILRLCAVPAFLRPDQTPPTVVQTAIALDLVIDYDVPQIIGAAALTIENVEFVTDRAPATSSVFRDWLYTVGWYEALRNGRKLSEVMEGYRAPNSSR